MPEMTRMDAVRAGSRWLYAEPTEDEVKGWFATQPLHDGMAHDAYVNGIVVIAQEEKAKVTMLNANDQMFVREEQRATFTPYMKVDTRVRYFWDYVTHLNTEECDEKYVGVIRPAPVPRITDAKSPFFNAHLPEGFGIHAVRDARDGNKGVYRFVVATFECLIAERQSWKEAREGAPLNCVLRGRGVKQVPMNVRGGWADEAAMMKAETGAIGRALGVAGVLVIGTGVASAEDMQEAVHGGGVGASGAVPSSEPALPPVVDREGAPVGAESVQEAATGEEATIEADQVAEQPPEDPEAADAALRAQAEKLRAELQAIHPDAWDAYVAWWQSRNFGKLEDLKGSALKGAVVKLERSLDEAKGGAS